jgi:pectinesterase
VDFVCPRGWCYVTNCTFFEMKNTAAVWHDGARNVDMKFVLRDCKFDGTNGWNLARHHHDAQFYFIDCTFSKTMIDRAPFRVIYPLNSSTPTEADIKRNADLDKSNVWGERSYFFNCHRDGGDYAWLKDNLSSATNAPAPGQINAAWTFAGQWNPEQATKPVIRQIHSRSNQVALTFSESVTVKGKPRLVFQFERPDNGRQDRHLVQLNYANYLSGSGSDTLVFEITLPGRMSVDLNGGAIIASEAGAAIRHADLSLPR